MYLTHFVKKRGTISEQYQGIDQTELRKIRNFCARNALQFKE